MNILITGASGFVGSYLKSSLNDKDNVWSLDRVKDPKHKEYPGKGKFIECDLCNLYDDHLTFCKTEELTVVHLAAARTDDASSGEYIRDNITATKSLLSVISNYKILTFIHVSSVAAIDGAKLSSNSHGFSSDDLYRQTKYQQEQLIENFCAAHKIKCVIIAPSAIYDDKARHDTNIGTLQRLSRQTPLIPIIKTKKSLTNIRDLIARLHYHINNNLDLGNGLVIRELLIDTPILSVTEIILQNKIKQPYIAIHVPYLFEILLLTAYLFSKLNLTTRLTPSRVKKIFKDTSYGDQTRYDKLT